VKLKKGCIQVSQNQFYRITLLTFYFLFLNLGVIYANIEKPVGKKTKFLLNIEGKERAYHELDENGLNYEEVGKNFEMGDSIRIVIYSRSIKAQTGRKIRKYGFTVKIDDKLQKLEYEKYGSNVTSVDRPGWNYTQPGVWFVYLPVKEIDSTAVIPPQASSPDKGYKIKVELKKGSPVVYLRVASHELKKPGGFSDRLKTVNRQDLWRIGAGNEKKIKTTHWYSLKKDEQLQYKIKGPASVKVLTRIEFNKKDSLLVKGDYYMRIREDGYDLGTYYFNTEKSDVSSILKTGNTVSKWRSAWLNIPKGIHYYTFTLPNIDDNSEKTVYLRLKEWQEEK